MKKAFIVLAFVAALFITEKAQAQLNLYAGYAPELMYTSTPSHDTTLFYHGVNLGLSWEFNLTHNLKLKAGAQFRMNLRGSTKSYWVEYEETETPGDPEGSYLIYHNVNERQSLIDIPILLKYNIPAGSKVIISPFVGPMLSWGIKGSTFETDTWPVSLERKREWYGENGYKSRFNVYAMAGLDIDFKQFTITLGGRYGFLNPNKLNASTTTTKAYGFFINFGHTF